MNHALFMIMAAILVLMPLIAIHEFGHYWVARRLGVKVIVYSIGFGPTLWQWQSKRSGIQYRLSALPLGGYVRMLDEREGPVASHEQHLSFNRQSPWKRMAIVAAGPLVNLLLAVVLFWGLNLAAGDQLNTRIHRVIAHSVADQAGIRAGDQITAIDGQATPTWEKLNYALLNRMGETGTIEITLERNQHILYKHLPIQSFIRSQNESPVRVLGFLPYQPALPPVVGNVLEEGRAFQQGLRAGDKIIAINGQAVTDWSQVVEIIRRSPERSIEFTVQRHLQQFKLNIVPQGRKDATGQVNGFVGAGIAAPRDIIIPDAYKKSYGPVQALGLAIDKTYQMSVMTVEAIAKMIKGLIGLDNLSGPITIAKVAGQSAEMGWQTFFGFMAMMSVSLGVLNLLPIPMLDGGHLVYYTIEAIRGRPLSEQLQMFGLKIGMALLGTMMIIALFNDIMRF